MVIKIWAGKTPKEIAVELNCHPKTVRTHLTRFNPEGINRRLCFTNDRC
jgi:DNA-binding NarL/FixJ family response regulator